MILLKNNSRYNSLRKFMSIPVLLVLFFACSVKNKDQEIANTQRTVDVVVDKVYAKPEVEASFPGGSTGWMRYLNRTFRYPMEAQEQEIQGTVRLEFNVEKDGTVTNIKAVDLPAIADKDHLSGVVVSSIAKNKKIEQIKATREQADILKKEAIRVISASGKWIPATINGKIVSSLKLQPITFKLEAQ